MRNLSFLVGFLIAIAITVFVLWPLIFFVHYPHIGWRWLRRQVRRWWSLAQGVATSMMSARYYAIAGTLSLAVLLIVAAITVANGNTIPNLFDPANTSFYFGVGLVVGTVGAAIAMFIEFATAALNL